LPWSPAIRTHLNSRTRQDFEERGELLSKTTMVFGDHSVKTNPHGGVIALQRAGDTNVNAAPIGRNLAFADSRHPLHGRD
jgi:hypothetical protein